MGQHFTPGSCRNAWRVMLREARIARGDIMSPCTKVCKLDKASSTYCYVSAATTTAATMELYWSFLGQRFFRTSG